MSTIRTEIASRALSRLEAEQWAIEDWMNFEDSEKDFTGFSKIQHAAYINMRLFLDRREADAKRKEAKNATRA